MATVKTSSPVFYSNGSSGASTIVGYEGGRIRVARYSFTSPAEGATSISISVGYAKKGDSDCYASSPYVYISTSSGYPSGIPTGITNNGVTAISNNVATASVKYTFLPSKTYYIWIYPRNTSSYGYWVWSNDVATITTSGSTAAVTPTITPGSLAIGGGSFVITAKPPVNGYKCKLTYKVGSISLDKVEDYTSYESSTATVSTDYEGTISSFQNATINSASAKFTVTCTTYDASGSQVGSANTVSAILTMPTGDLYDSYFKPTASLISESVTSNDMVKEWESSGSYVAGYSKIKLSPDYDKNQNDVEGVTMNAYSLSCGSSNIWKGNSFGASYECILKDTGKVIPKLNVTDSRGNSVSVTASTYNVYSYFKPSLRLAARGRCSSTSSGLVEGDKNYTPAANGTKVYIKLDSVSFASVNGNNKCTASVKCNAVDVGSFEISATTSEYEFITEIENGFDLNKTYEVEVVLIDSLGNTSTITADIPKRTVGLHLMSGGLGAAVGKYSEEEGIFDIGFKTRFYNGVQPVELNSSDSIDDCVVPNIYTGSNSTYNGNFVLEVLPVGAGNNKVFQRIHYYDTNDNLLSAERYQTDNDSWTIWLGMLSSDGFYNYIMHPNGTAECWRSEPVSNWMCNNTGDYMAGWYSSDDLTLIDFPSVQKKSSGDPESLFSLVPFVNVTFNSTNGSGAIAWNYYGKSATSPGTIKFLRPSESSVTGYIDIYAIGSWR